MLSKISINFLPFLFIIIIIVSGIIKSNNARVNHNNQEPADYQDNYGKNTQNISGNMSYFGDNWNLPDKCKNCQWDNCKLSVVNIEQTKKQYRTETEITEVKEFAESYCVQDL